MGKDTNFKSRDALKIFESTPTATFGEIFNRFLFQSVPRMRT